MTTIWIGLVIAGALGAGARFWLDGAIQRRAHATFPWGTLAINASGSFLLGIIDGAAIYHGFGSKPTTILGTGFCGAFTTFSTWSYETVRLLEEGETADAAINAIGTLILCGCAAGLGLAVAAR